MTSSDVTGRVWPPKFQLKNINRKNTDDVSDSFWSLFLHKLTQKGIKKKMYQMFTFNFFTIRKYSTHQKLRLCF